MRSVDPSASRDPSPLNASVVPIARRMLARSRARLAVTAGGIGVTIALVLFLLSVYEGVTSEASRWIRTRPSDVWVSNGNSNNLMRSVSYLPESLGIGLETLPGIERATPLIRVAASVRIGRDKASFFVLGVDPDALATLPEVVEGASAPSEGELIVDRSFATKHRLVVGDTIHIRQMEFRVAGISRGTNALVTQFAFGTLEDGKRLLGFDGLVSYYLLDAEPGVTAEAVRDTLNDRFDDVSAFTGPEFVENNLNEMRTGILPLLFSVITFSILVGAAVLALLLYADVLERRSEYALLMAIGASPRTVDSIVLRQAGLVIVLGLLAGGMLFAISVPIAAWLAPELSFRVALWMIPSTIGVAMAIGLLAAWLPLWRLRGIYPGEVFRP